MEDATHTLLQVSVDIIIDFVVYLGI